MWFLNILRVLKSRFKIVISRLFFRKKNYKKKMETVRREKWDLQIESHF